MIREFESFGTADWKEPETKYATGATRGDVLAELLWRGKHLYATGSRVTAFYDKVTSDYDYVVLDNERWELHDHYVSNDNWEAGESGNQYSTFQSLKKQMKDSTEVVNLIFVNSKDMFTKYCMASDLIRTVNPSTKKERTQLFDLIFQGSKEPF
jgi:hypothetical protein